MKAKTLLAVLLLVHLLAHPAMHAFLAADSPAAAPASFSAGGDSQSRARPEGSNCYLCRTTHALIAPAATETIFHAAVEEAISAAAATPPPSTWRAVVPARAPPVS